MINISKLLVVGTSFAALTGAGACEDNTATAGWVDGQEATAISAADSGQATGERVSSRDPNFEAFGFYIPTRNIQFGNWRLDHVHIASHQEFAEWEAGRMGEYFFPVHANFSDITSPSGTNELGGEYHEVTTRVRADYYRIEDGVFTFEGTDPELGAVIISGTLHGDVVGDEDSDAPAFTGSMEVGGNRDRNISFSWYGGH